MDLTPDEVKFYALSYLSGKIHCFSLSNSIVTNVWFEHFPVFHFFNKPFNYKIILCSPKNAHHINIKG